MSPRRGVLSFGIRVHQNGRRRTKRRRDVETPDVAAGYGRRRIGCRRTASGLETVGAGQGRASLTRESAEAPRGVPREARRVASAIRSMPLLPEGCATRPTPRHSASERRSQRPHERRGHLSGLPRGDSSVDAAQSELMPTDCRHHPPCPKTSTRWVCAQRSRIEDAVSRGLIARQAGWTLLTKYGCPMSPMSRVERGDPPSVMTQEKLV